MVAASQPLAVSAGLEALRRGGSFADAALATSAVLAVVEPHNSHLGGDAFIIVYDAKTGTTTALNGSGAAPQAATPDRFPTGIPLRGLAAASVPGLVDAWFTLHARWGRLPVADLFAPAIDYAENGYPVSFRTARVFAYSDPLFREFPATLHTLTGGVAPAPGRQLRQPDLAWTLRRIAEGGRDAFYAGPITERFLSFGREHDGLFAAEDFAAHRTEVRDPIRVAYRDHTVHGQPPPSQGHILLQELNLVEGFDLAGMGHNSADAIHVGVEAKKLAFADRAAYLGDPRFVDVPLDTLLSKPYADGRRGLIDLQRAATHATAGQIDHDTTYFCVADGEGNAVSFIQSVFWGYGCAVIPEGTGVLFNNRMTGFSLDPNSPNRLEPGKRTAHTLNAYAVTRPGDAASGGRERLAFVGGTPGADIQVQSNLQVICNVIDFGMNPQEAIEAPRWQHGPSVGGGPGEESLAIEDRLPATVQEELARRGHALTPLGAWEHGSSYQLIAVDPDTGAYFGGSDPRCDGHAAGF
jgi:gamma-glutamyltranspeptidase/glutathione hydrolase